jgi:hypothetical protein
MCKCNGHREDIPDGEPSLLLFETNKGWAWEAQHDHRNDITQKYTVWNEICLKRVN